MGDVVCPPVLPIPEGSFCLLRGDLPGDRVSGGLWFRVMMCGLSGLVGIRFGSSQMADVGKIGNPAVRLGSRRRVVAGPTPVCDVGHGQ